MIKHNTTLDTMSIELYIYLILKQHSVSIDAVWVGYSYN